MKQKLKKYLVTWREIKYCDFYVEAESVGAAKAKSKMSLDRDFEYADHDNFYEIKSVKLVKEDN